MTTYNGNIIIKTWVKNESDDYNVSLKGQFLFLLWNRKLRSVSRSQLQELC